MNLRILSIITSGLSVFFLVLLLTRGCDKPTTKPDDNELWRERVRQRDEVIRVKDSIIAAITQKRTVDEAKFAKTETALQGQIKAKDKSLAQARQDIAEFRTQLPQVETFVVKADSAIAVRDSLINAMGMRMRAAEWSYKEELRVMGERNVVQRQVSELQATKIIDLESRNDKLSKRLERKKKFNRVLGGVALGLGAALGLIIATQ